MCDISKQKVSYTPNIEVLPSNVLSLTYFLGKTFFFSKIFLGDPPLNFFGGVSKIQVYGKMK